MAVAMLWRKDNLHIGGEGGDGALDIMSTLDDCTNTL
jgi:hypothetical protein